MTRLLEGYRIIESSMLLNGASTGMMLTDLGAEVIKVESPFLGDYLRAPGTFHMHLQTNKNKRSIALDLRSESGRDVFYRLLDTADAFVTNAVGDRNDRLGIGFEQLRARKPAIVYCQYTGWGASGPWSRIPTHGQMMDAMAGALPVQMGDDGFTHFVVPPDGRRTGTLTAAGEGTAIGAIYAAFHVAAGLAHAATTGEGCYIDVAAATAVLASNWVATIGLLHRRQGAEEVLSGFDSRAVARYQFYETMDGKFVLFCPEEDKFWQAFCAVVERPDLVDQLYGVELRRTLQAIMSTKTQAEWMAIAAEHRLPIGPAHSTIDEVLDDPQIQSRQLFVEGGDPDGNPHTYVGQPALVDGQPSGVHSAAPVLGEHTTEILLELGYDNDTIAELAAAEVTSSPDYRQDGPIGDIHGREQPTGA